MKIVFLDIDGVLNSDEYFAKNHEEVKEYYKNNKDLLNNIDKLVYVQLLDIDKEKLHMLIHSVNDIGAKVVITSSWKKLKVYPQLKEKLIDMGLPIIGETIDTGSDRGTGIKKYLLTFDIKNYVIFDDDIFDDYDDEIMLRLIKTNFFDGGLKKEDIEKMISMFNCKIKGR